MEPFQKIKIVRSDKKCLLNMIFDYLEICKRCFLVFNEYKFFGRYYLPEDRLNVVIRRAFTFHNNTRWTFFALICTALVRFGMTGRPLLPPVHFLLFMPVYWICFMANVSHSTLDYPHWIRAPHGLDSGTGLAANYFHGYLNLSLPARNGNKGIRKLIQIYEDVHNVSFGIDRLIILVPDEMFVNDTLESDLLEKVAPLETVYIDRAGVNNRPFRHAVYRLTKPINGKTYFFAMEGATPMLSYFNAINFPMSTTWQMQEMKREIFLKFCKTLKAMLHSWPETRREVELIIYNSHDIKGDRVDIGELIWHQFAERIMKNKQ